MKLELVKNSTDISEITTKYHTSLRIDDQYDVKITLIENLTNLNDEEQISEHIIIDIEEYPSHLTLDQANELKNNIETFVLDYNDLIIEDTKKLS